jgi:TP901 family phage tail tape measure protein
MAAKTYAEFEVKVLLNDLASTALQSLDKLLDSIIQKSDFKIAIGVDKKTQETKKELDLIKKSLINIDQQLIQTKDNIEKTSFVDTTNAAQKLNNSTLETGKSLASVTSTAGSGVTETAALLAILASSFSAAKKTFSGISDLLNNVGTTTSSISSSLSNSQKDFNNFNKKFSDFSKIFTDSQKDLKDSFTGLDKVDSKVLQKVGTDFLNVSANIDKLTSTINKIRSSFTISDKAIDKMSKRLEELEKNAEAPKNEIQQLVLDLKALSGFSLSASKSIVKINAGLEGIVEPVRQLNLKSKSIGTVAEHIKTLNENSKNNDGFLVVSRMLKSLPDKIVNLPTYLKDIGTAIGNINEKANLSKNSIGATVENLERLVKKSKTLATDLAGAGDAFDTLRSKISLSNQRFLAANRIVNVQNRRLLTLAKRLQAVETQYNNLKSQVASSSQNVKGFNKNLNSTNATISQTNHNLLKTHGLMENVGLIFASFATIEFFSSALKSSADFEHELSVIRAITNNATKDMDLLEAKARELGATTLHTATEAATGMQVLARAGLSTQQILDTIPSVLSLATAAELELAEASQFLVNTANQMKIPFAEVERIADVLQATSATSSTTVKTLGNAMNYVGPAARIAGLSLEQTAAAIGILHDNGIRGTRAGRGLRQVLSRLNTPTSEARKTLLEMGYSVNDLTAFLTEMGSASKAEIKYVASLFGLVASPTIITLIEEGGEALNTYAEEIKSLGDASDKAAAVMTDDLIGSFRLMTSAWDAARQAFTEPLTEDLRVPIDELANSFRDLAADADFGSIAQAFSSFLSSLAGGVVNVIQLMIEFKTTTVTLISVLTVLLGIKIGLFFAGLAAKVWTFVVALNVSTTSVIANTATLNASTIATTRLFESVVALGTAWGATSAKVGIFTLLLSGLKKVLSFAFFGTLTLAARGLSLVFVGLAKSVGILKPIIMLLSTALIYLKGWLLVTVLALGPLGAVIAALTLAVTGTVAAFLYFSRSAEGATVSTKKLTEADLALIKAKKALAKASADAFKVEIKDKREVLYLTTQERQEYAGLLTNAAAYWDATNDGSEEYMRRLFRITRSLQDVRDVQATLEIEYKSLELGEKSYFASFVSQNEMLYDSIENIKDSVEELKNLKIYVDDFDDIEEAQKIVKNYLEDMKERYNLTQSFINSLSISKPFVDANDFTKKLNASVAQLRLEYELTLKKIEYYNDVRILSQKEINDLTLEEADTYKVLLDESVNFYKTFTVQTLSSNKYQKTLNETVENLAPILEYLHYDARAMGVELSEATLGNIDNFYKLQRAGKSAGDILSEIWGDFADKINVEAIRELEQEIVHLEDAGVTAEIAAGSLREGLEKLNVNELYDFQDKIIAAFFHFSNNAERSTKFFAQTLSAAFKLLQINIDEFNQDTTKSGETVLKAFEIIAHNTETTSKQMIGAIEKTFELLNTTGEFEAFKDSLTATFNAGNIGLEEYGAKIDEIDQKILKLQITLSGLDSDFKTLNIESVSNITESLDEIEESYNNIKQAQTEGRVSTEDLRNAFVSYAKKKLELLKQINSEDLDAVQSMLAFEASILGVTDRVDSLKESYDELEESKDKTIKGNEKIKDSIDATTGTILAYKVAIDDFAGTSVAAVEKFKEVLQNTLRTLPSVMDGFDQYIGNFSQYFQQMGEAYDYVAGVIENQEKIQKNLGDLLDSNIILSDQQIQSLEVSVDALNLLDDSSLDKIRGQIEKLKERSQALKESVSETVETLRDEFRALSDASDDIDFDSQDVTIAYLEKRNELQQIYNDALAFGDAVTISNAQESLELSEKIYKINLEKVSVLEKLNRKIQATGEFTRDEAETIQQLGESLSSVSGTDLTNINEQISEFVAKITALTELRESVKATLDELDTSAANDLQVAHYEKILELEEKLKLAKELNDAQSIEKLEYALELTEQQFDIKFTLLEKETKAYENIRKALLDSNELSLTQVESMQEIVSSFELLSDTDLGNTVEELEQLAQKIEDLNSLREAIKDTLDELDTSAANDLQVAHYEKILGLEEQLIEAKRLNDAESIANVKEALKITEEQYNVKFETLENELLAHEKIKKALSNSETLSLSQVKSMQEIVSSFELLGDADLNNITTQLEEIAGKIEDLNSLRKSIKSTLDELDTSAANDLQVAHYEKILGLEEQLIEAKRLNDAESIANINRIIDFNEQNYDEKIKLLKEETAAYSKIKTALNDSSNLSAAQVDSMKAIVSSFELLSQTDLGNVSELLEDIVELNALRDSIKSTLDELDTSAANDLQVAHYGKILDLEEQLIEAKRLNDTESIANVKKALKITEANYGEKIKLLKEETAAYEKIRKALNDSTNLSETQVGAMQEIVSSFELLSDTDLGNITEQLEKITDLTDLRKSIGDTLAELDTSEVDNLKIEHYEKILDLENQLIEAKRLNDTESIENIHKAIDLTNVLYDTEIHAAKAQEEAFEKINNDISDINELTDAQSDNYIDIIDSLGDIDNTDLSNLYGQLQDINQATQTLRDSLADTVSSLEKTLLRELGEEQKITELEYQEDILELEEQLQQARSLGDDESINSALKALQIREQLYNIAVDEYNTEKEAAKLKKEEIANEERLAKLKEEELKNEKEISEIKKDVTPQKIEETIDTTTTKKVITTKTINLQFISPSNKTATVEVDTDSLVDKIISILTESGAVIA